MNVYVRQNNNDLLKYLTDEEIASLEILTEKVELAPNELISLDPGTVNVVVRGIINIVPPKSDKTFMTISAGEVFGEEKLFQNVWSLAYKSETQTVFIKYNLDFSLISDNENVKARLHAAINDSLAEKLIRLTHNT